MVSQALPLGSRAFQEQFLRASDRHLQLQCEALLALASTIVGVGHHMAAELLQRSVLAGQIHLLRALHVAFTDPWIVQVDRVIQCTARSLLGVQDLGRRHVHLLQFPGTGRDWILLFADLSCYSRALMFFFIAFVRLRSAAWFQSPSDLSGGGCMDSCVLPL